MLWPVNSEGVKWWGYTVGDAWVLSALVIFVVLAAIGYLVQHIYQQRRR